MCDQNNHQFIPIAEYGHVDDAAKVVRWCGECGAISVDLDDGLTINRGEVMPAKLPRLRLINDKLEKLNDTIDRLQYMVQDYRKTERVMRNLLGCDDD